MEKRMWLVDAIKLARANLAAGKGRNLATIVVVGTLFGLVLGVNFVLQGLENTLMNCANEQTDNIIYMVSERPRGALGEVLGKYQARVVGMLPTTILPMKKEALQVNQSNDIGDLNLLDMALDGIYSGASAEELGLVEDGGKYWLNDDEKILLEFTDVKMAYAYQEKLEEERKVVTEFVGNQVGVYRVFRRWGKVLSVLGWILVVVAVIIMVFTLAHLLAQEVATVALYRALGAETKEILLVYFLVLLGLGLGAVAFAVIVGLVLAGVVSWLNADSLAVALESFYPVVISKPVLIGLNGRTLEIIGVMLTMVPVSFILSIDQISGKKLARKLKED